MNDLNTGVIVGRLTKDFEIGYLQSGSAKLDFSIAFSTSKKQGNEWITETNYLNNLTLWGKQAENLVQYLKKGTMVGVQYHLKVDTYEKDGQKKSLLKPVVDNLQLLGGKSSNNSGGGKPNNTGSNGDSFQEDIPF